MRIAYITAGAGGTICGNCLRDNALVAALPSEALIQDPPRVGHPDKFIPLRYLASRRDIAILEGWAQAVADRDCSFPDHTESYLNSAETWAPWKLFPIDTGS